jgi:hypothetical protein
MREVCRLTQANHRRQWTPRVRSVCILRQRRRAAAATVWPFEVYPRVNWPIDQTGRERYAVEYERS